MSLIHAFTNSHSGGTPGLVARFILRFFQFVLALTVAGLYGVDLGDARAHHKYSDSKWVYAEVVAGLSCFTVLVYAVPLLKTHWLFMWDFLLFILWTALFGVFGKIYIGSKSKGDDDITRMQHAVWVDLTCMLLWFITAIYSGIVFWLHRKGRSLHTGRARV